MACFKGSGFNFELNKKTYILGILNVTPDSFSDGGDFVNIEDAVNRAIQMEKDGADMIDIGGQSTRPGFTAVSEKEELNRIIPVLDALKGIINVPLSIDTFYPTVAKEALNLGVAVINDVSGFKDKEMIKLAAESNCGNIVMHCGSGGIKEFFKEKSRELSNAGIKKERVCFDVGIGFGKDEKECLDIIKNLSDYKLEPHALLMGLSRKRVIGYPLNNPPFKDRLYGTIAANTISVLGGADILRVHDVKAAVDAAKVTDAILGRNI